MKKAYVKPVFMAEEYELTASVAGCEYSPSKPFEIWKGTYICASGQGHSVGQGNPTDDPVLGYWDYATAGRYQNYDTKFEGHGYQMGNEGTNNGAYVFTGAETQCDFVWNSYNGDIGVWKDSNNNLIKNETDRSNEGSWIDRLGYTFMQFFRTANSSCSPLFQTNEGSVVPFSN